MYYTGQMNADEAVWRLTEVVRCKHLTPASKRISRLSIRRYCEVLQGLPQHLRGEHKLERFLTVLAQKAAAVKTCSPSRRNSSPEVICAYNAPRNLSEKWVVRATRPDRSATCRPEWRREAVLPGRRDWVEPPLPFRPASRRTVQAGRLCHPFKPRKPEAEAHEMSGAENREA